MTERRIYNRRHAKFPNPDGEWVLWCYVIIFLMIIGALAAGVAAVCWTYVLSHVRFI